MTTKPYTERDFLIHFCADGAWHELPQRYWEAADRLVRDGVLETMSTGLWFRLTPGIMIVLGSFTDSKLLKLDAGLKTLESYA